MPSKKGKKKTLTEEQQQIVKEYKALRRKITRRVRDIKKRGYSLPENFVPSIPKNIQKGSIRNLEKYTLDYIYKHSVYISPEGTKKKGYEARKEERSAAARKGAETRKKFFEAHKQYIKSEEPAKGTDIIMMNLDDLLFYFGYQDLTRWSSELVATKEKDVNMMKKMLDDAIAQDGKDVVLKRINDNASDIYDIISTVIYESGEKYRADASEGTVNSKIMLFGQIVKGHSLTVEESAFYTEYAEQVSTIEVRG